MAYDNHIVLDFEFNPVLKENRELLKYEIVEIGAVKLDENYKLVDKLSLFVKPELNSAIEQKIIKLTGIRLADVENAMCFEDALYTLADWIGYDKNTRVYSWSESDLWQLDDECYIKDAIFPENMYRWMDLQKIFERIIGYPDGQSLSLAYAANMLNVGFSKDKAHRAVYDAEVTAGILQKITSSEYSEDLAKAKKIFVKEETRSTFSLGSSCSEALSRIMQNMVFA